jgi:hypothetical protein
MPADPLRDILSSPLDEDDPPGRGRDAPVDGGASRPLWFVASMIVGALIVLVAYLVARPGEAPAPPDGAHEPPATTAAPTETAPRLPPGFTSVGEPFGVRVERILIGPDAVFVTISAVVLAGVDGELSAAFPGGSWDLVFADGARTSSIDELVDPSAPGYTTIRFDTSVGGPEGLASLEYTGVGLRSFEALEHTTITGVILPEDGSEVPLTLDPARHRLADGTTLAFDDFTMSSTGGSMSWGIAGDDPTRAAVHLVVDVIHDETNIVRLGGQTGQLPTFSFGFGPPALLPGVLLPGGEVLFTASEPLPTDTELSLVLWGDITWMSFTPAGWTIPIGDAPVDVVD